MFKKQKLGKIVISGLMAATIAVSTLAYNAPVVLAEESKIRNETIQQEFYVAPNGDNQNPGTTPEKPFADVEQARAAVAKINSNMTGDILVNIAPGNYYISETIEMTKEDSGTNGHEVIYRCTGEPGTARLIGGEKVTGQWELAVRDDVKGYDLAEDMLGKVYRLQLDADKYQFNTLYINGRRATMARTLNRENNPRFPMAGDGYMLATAASSYSISYPKDILPESAAAGIENAIGRGEEGAQVYGWDWDYRNWFTSTIPITGINTATGTLSFTRDPDDPTRNRPKFDFGAGARFFLQGNLAFLDTPGEYHYNKKTGVLYYYPEAGEENLADQEIIVPVLQEIFRLEGDAKDKLADVPDPDQMVHNITFEGLQAGYTEFTDNYSSGWNSSGHQSTITEFPPEALEEGITNPSYCEQTERPALQKGVFHLKQTHHITFDKMQIVNAGLIGIVVWKDNNNITIQNSEIANTGLFGINIDGGYPGREAGKYSYGHLVTNNVIHNVGELVGHGTGIQILQVHDSEFSHMEIYDATRRAIFLQGGWDYRHKEDQEKFNRYLDSATYNNHLEYLYLHDLQQDGGDDGAIFFCTLYRFQGYQGNGVDETRPNYLNQVYMDRVGAAPSTDDFTPNCINFDMGCGGVIASNIKAVNPQHYNIRYNEGQNEVTFDNVNLAYYHPVKGGDYQTFDDSRMEYDKIGVNGDFPYRDAVTNNKDKSYDDVYFRDEFDNGLDEWWSLAGQPTTSPVYFSDMDPFGPDNNSFLADALYHASSEGCLIGKPFGSDLNKIVEIDYFDHTSIPKDNGYCGMGFQYKLNSFARADNGTALRAIGVDYGVSSRYYSYQLGSITKVTDIPREYGWHTFKWDYTDGKNVKMYIDGKHIATAAGENFDYIEMGDYGMGGFNAYDNVVIYGGSPAADPIPLPPLPETPEPEEKVIPGRIEAENSDSRTGATQIVDGASGGKAVGYLSVGDIYTYNVTVSEDFDLPLTVLYASNGAAGFKLLVDDAEKMTVTLPVTGGWSSYKEHQTDDTLQLTAGEHVLKIQVTANNFNIDSFGFLGKELPPELVEVTGVEVPVKEPLILAVGNTVKVPVAVLPVNANNKAVVWSSDDTEGTVITVSADGTITAKGIGTANVTVRSLSNTAAVAAFAVEVQDTKASLISTADMGCTASANVPSEGSESKYGPAKLIDGNVDTPWVPVGSSGTGHKDQPSCYLEWETPQTVRSIRVYNRKLAGFYASKFQVIFNDDIEHPLIYELPELGMTEILLPQPREGVYKIEVQVLEQVNIYGNSGLGEIEVFSAEPGSVPANSVFFTPGSATLLQGESLTLNPPVVVPSTATNSKLELAVMEGADVIRFRANTMDGVIRNYTITALKLGTAVIRATAENGVYADFTVTVGSRGQLEDKIIEAENLYAKFSGDSDAHKAFKAVIDEALKVYKNSQDPDDYAIAAEKLENAMKDFLAAVTPDKTAQEVLDTVTIPQPEKKTEALTLPDMPAGYRIEIVSSTENRIAADGRITWPMKEQQVTAKARVTRIFDNSCAEKDFEFTLQGIGKAWGAPMEANDIDALDGTYIKIQNNEVANFNPGDWIRYDNVDFGENDRISSLFIETAVHPDWAGKTIEVVLDDIGNGPVIGSIIVKPFGNDWGIYGTQEAVLNQALSGYRTIYLRGVAGGSNPNEGVAGIRTICLNTPSEIPAATYPITVDSNILNGVVTADKMEAEAGEIVTITVTPEEGCRFVEGSLKVTTEDGEEVEAVETGADVKQFVMPEGAVSITAQFAEIVKYAISVSSNDAAMGTIIPDKTEAEEGEEVTVTVSSGDGYYLVEDSLKANDEPIQGGKFAMPGMDVLITGVFEALPPMNYSVEIIPAANGTITASPISAPAGTQIVLTVVPDEGCRLTEGSLRVTSEDGTLLEVTAEDTFIMPEGNVTVTAAFEKIPTDFSGLQEVYDQYKDLTQGNYTNASWNEFMLKKLAAEAVLNNQDADQEEVDAARDSLKHAYSRLEEKPSTGNSYRILLQKTYDYARNLSTEGAVDTAARKFQDALANAKSMLDSQDATDAQLEEAFDGLLQGIWGLGLTKGNKTALEFLIAKADLMVKDADKYTAVNWQLLLDELEDAREVMADGDAMEEDIKPAVDELLDAVLKQRFKARKDILEGILNKAGTVDESLYTEESVQGFRTAFAYAKEIMADDTLSEDDQDEVNKAAADLDEAILKLVKKDDTENPADPSDPGKPGDPTDPSAPGKPGDPTDPSAPGKPGDPADPSDPGKPGDPADPSDPGKPGDPGDPSDPADQGDPTDSGKPADPGNPSDDSTIVSPKTGDYFNMGLALLMISCGTVCVSFAAARRKKREGR